MKTPSNPTLPSKACARWKPGFALIVTLSLMILLTVIAVGLLTLSSISLRSSSQGAGVAMARANARMSLMLAMGELQKQSGLDTRITARADVLDVKNPPVAGVWKSWEGTDHEPSGSYQGRPISPGNYATKKKDRFLGWLTSGDPATATTLPNTTKGSNKAILVGDFTVGKGVDREKLQIHLTPSQIVDSKQKGAFAWWVGGENQKARLPNPYQPEDTSARWAANLKSHSVADTEPFRMDDLLTDATPAIKAITLKQGDLVAKPGALQVSREFFHDLSATSMGLLTNTATGGWKKDLSLLTENWALAGTSNLPFFRVKPGEDILGNIPTSGNPLAAKSMLYPWSAYRGNASNIPIAQHGAVTSWENLKDFALAYQGMGMTIPASGSASMSSRSVAIDGNSYNFLHKVRVLPVIARVQWVFSYWAAKTTGTNYEPRLLLTPTVTMWNPYNVQLTTAALDFRIGKPLPVALRFNVGGIQNSAYNNLNGGTINNTPALDAGPNMYYQITAPFTLKPGEARIFSPQSTTKATPATKIVLEPGYRNGGGHYFALKNDAGAKLVSVGTASIKTDAKFDTTYEDTAPGGTPSFGVGIYLNMEFGTSRHLAYRMDYETSVAQSVYPPLSGMAASPSLADIEAKPSPFLTTIFGARMASRTHIAAKGFVQSSPLVNFTAMGNKDTTEPTIARQYGGTSHPVNSPFDYSFEKVAGAGDTVLPQANDATNRGYIVTGFNSAEGLSRCVIGELPLRPLASLAELQNWDLRYENPIPPFAYNLIGNSDASPLLPANAVVNPADSALATNLQHDDSYCANHLLFDDWIFSSISPDPTTFGTTGRTLKQNYTDFITGLKPLGNRAYQPIVEDTAKAAISQGNVTTLFNEQIDKADSWKTIASRLEVEGMFNVNSTSVTAWRALLGHARNQKIPYIKDTGASWSIALSAKRDHAFSRFSIAGDVEAKEQGSSGGFPEAAEFSGYRILDDKLLDALAAEIVNQVRKRGPFLSLSEFINRQLSSGDLALAGTIQAALNQISKTPATNPYSEIIAMGMPVSSATPAGNPEYKFPDAAVGQISYGLPGWTRQADILRPLAPILSARDDTFTIRSYGDSRDAAGKIVATAVCEAVVRRTRDFVDSSEKADITTLPTTSVNRTFGRRYQMVSFRWLSAGEI